MSKLDQQAQSSYSKYLENSTMNEKEELGNTAPKASMFSPNKDHWKTPSKQEKESIKYIFIGKCKTI
jgi:hypothetical protein